MKENGQKWEGYLKTSARIFQNRPVAAQVFGSRRQYRRPRKHNTSNNQARREQVYLANLFDPHILDIGYKQKVTFFDALN
jgi:hypothetical protein